MKAYYELNIKSYFRRYIDHTKDIYDALSIICYLYQSMNDQQDKFTIEVVSQKQYKCKIRVIHDIENNDDAYEFIQKLFLKTELTKDYSLKYKLKFLKQRKQ